MTTTLIRRLGRTDREAARAMFGVMAHVFEEHAEPLGDDYLDRLLARDDFWALAAFADEREPEVVGGLTAHTLPMTRSESAELFIYDLAVRADRQRSGIGRALVGALRELAANAGIAVVFVPADDDDHHALEFYRAVGGTPSPVTFFTFGE